MKFIDLFAGIGGFRTGMEMNGHECVAFCEIDKYARKSYKAMYNTEGEAEYHDITKVTNDEWRKYRGTVDVICGGFPCQAFSIAGKRGGFEDTRGTLFFEIARAAEQIKPRILLLENVRGLLSHDKGRTFATILTALDELGYDAQWRVLNSKNFGVPQNRERVYIIGHLRGSGSPPILPAEKQSGNNLKCIGRLDVKGDDIIRRVYDPEGLSPTLTTMEGGNRQPKILLRSKQGYRIRKLTPRECWRLQGFTDQQFSDAKHYGVSNSQLYKQAGNSVTVNVIDAIARRLT